MTSVTQNRQHRMTVLFLDGERNALSVTASGLLRHFDIFKKLMSFVTRIHVILIYMLVFSVITSCIIVGCSGKHSGVIGREEVSFTLQMQATLAST